MYPRLASLSVVLIFGLSVFMAGSAVTGLAVVAEDATALQLEFDEEVPPGNPVVGSDAPGDIEESDKNYELLALIAIGLIGGGALLVKLEGWERRRSAHNSARS